MLQNPCKTLGFKKSMVNKILRGGGGKPYPSSVLKRLHCLFTPQANNVSDMNIRHQNIRGLGRLQSVHPGFIFDIDP